MRPRHKAAENRSVLSAIVAQLARFNEAAA